MALNVDGDGTSTQGEQVMYVFKNDCWSDELLKVKKNQPLELMHEWTHQ